MATCATLPSICPLETPARDELTQDNKPCFSGYCFPSTPPNALDTEAMKSKTPSLGSLRLFASRFHEIILTDGLRGPRASESGNSIHIWQLGATVEPPAVTPLGRPSPSQRPTPAQLFHQHSSVYFSGYSLNCTPY